MIATSNDDLTGAITAALEASGWIRTGPNMPPPDTNAAAFTHQALCLHPLIPSQPDEPPYADLTGGSAGNPAAWSVEIKSPTTEQALVATRSATDPDP